MCVTGEGDDIVRRAAVVHHKGRTQFVSLGDAPHVWVQPLHSDRALPFLMSMMFDVLEIISWRHKSFDVW